MRSSFCRPMVKKRELGYLKRDRKRRRRTLPRGSDRRTSRTVLVLLLSPSSSLPPESSRSPAPESATLPSRQLSSSSRNTDLPRAAWIACVRTVTRRTALASPVSSRPRQSRGGGGRQLDAPVPRPARLSECCGRELWCTPPCLGSHATPHASSELFSSAALPSYFSSLPQFQIYNVLNTSQFDRHALSFCNEF